MTGPTGPTDPIGWSLPLPFEIVGLVVSPTSRYDGRPSDGPGPGPGPDVEHPAGVDVRAHRGLVGDRYFGHRHAYAALTLIAVESIDRLEAELGTGPFDPFATRRNVLTRGLDVDALARTEFSVEVTGTPLELRSLTPANPCAWMDVVLAPGAHRALRGHGGIRCEPLTDATLAVGPATLTAVRPLGPDELSRRVRAALPG